MGEVLDGRQIRAFAEVARRGSFTKAARELSLTQSAVSHAMRALEADVGCALFYKVGKSVHLTEAGKRLFQRVERILHEMVLARNELGAAEQNDRGQLRIGCSTAASQYLLPLVLREFQDCFPQYGILVRPGDTPQGIELLRRGEVDLVIGLATEAGPGLRMHRIMDDELMLVVAPAHRCGGAARLTLRELKDETFLLYSRASVTGRLVEEWFLRHGVRIGQAIELGSFEAIKELAKLGLGIGVVAPWSLNHGGENGRLVARRFPRGGVKRTWGVWQAESRQLNLAEQTFVGLCEAAGKSIKRETEARDRGRPLKEELSGSK